MMEVYGKFRADKLSDRRFVHSKETLDFLEILAEIAKEKTFTIDSSQVLWRAQLFNDYVDEQYLLFRDVRRPARVYKRDRMFPLKSGGKENRINPKGTSCLYLAGSEKIAISEVRPSIGSYVCCSEFKVKEQVKIVKCSDTFKPNELDKMFEGLKTSTDDKEVVWFRVCQAFCTPVLEEDDNREYILTQVMAKKFKDLGYDGVAYKSIFSNSNDQEHLNIALFNPEKADLLNTRLFKVKGVDVAYECSVGEFDPETGNPISVDVP
jgi:hypothetical protein